MKPGLSNDKVEIIREPERFKYTFHPRKVNWYSLQMKPNSVSINLYKVEQV